MTRSILSLISLLLLAGPALADPREEARRHYQQAEAAYKVGQFQEAIAGYEAAYAALPKPALLFNIAQSYRQQYTLNQELADLKRALTVYRSYLRELPEAKNKQLVQDLIRELETEQERREAAQTTAAAEAPARLLIQPGPGAACPGSELRIDGELAGNLPFAGEISPGPHRLEVSQPGCSSWRHALSFVPGQTVELQAALTPLPEAEGPKSVAAATPFYKTWWFWTLTGAAVAGGAGAGIYFGTRGSESSSGLPVLDLR